MATFIVGPTTKRTVEMLDHHVVCLDDGQRKPAAELKAGDLILGLGRVVETIRTR